MFIKNIKLVLLLTVLYVSFPSLSWTEEACRTVFNEILEKLSEVDINQYKGQEGYIRFVEEFEEIQNMADIFDKVFETLDKEQKRVLRWKQFQGTVSEFYKLKDKILHDDSSIRREHQGLDGFLKLAKQYFSNDFLKTYRNVSAVLDKDQMIELGWQKLKKTILDFNRFAKPLLNKDASIKDEYKGQEAYVKFVEELEGIESMSYVFKSVSKVLGSVKMKELQWQEFRGTPEDFKKIKELLSLDVIKKYKGMAGYIRFAEEYFDGDMQKAYKNVSVVLSGSKLMKKLAWQRYQGSVSDFNDLVRNKIFKNGSVRAEYKGSEGYVLFAEKYFDGNMQKAYQNVSAILNGSDLMKKLEWQAYQGLVSDFSTLRNKIFKNGSVRAEYKGSEGYVLFAEKYFDGNMQKAYQNVSVVLGGGFEVMNQLAWRKYHGLVSEFNTLRNKIFKNGSVRAEYKGNEGYVLFAEKYFDGNMQKTYQNVSVILGGGSEVMNQLAWRKYHGLVSEFNTLRNKIFKNDSVRAEYKGNEGYVLFAEKYFDGNMQKAYQNVSVILGGVHEMRRLNIGWKRFQGTVDQFKELKELFESAKREELKGEKGQLRVAKEIFKGNQRKAYIMVSALREELLGSKEEFKELNWKQ